MGGYYELIYGDVFTWGLAIVGFIIVIWAQVKVNGTYGKYKKVKLSKDINGREAARLILEKNNLDIYVVETPGELTDHYDPSRRVIKLSPSIFRDSTVAAVAVAAHECGHAIQDKDGYTFMRIRTALVPVVNFISYAGYIAMFISIFAGAMQYFMIGILIVAATLLFQFITLPVELDASRRALLQLEELKIVTKEELPQAKEVLSAAAMTYIASVLASLLQLIRLVLLFNRDRD
jgi:Zn-dependent membrane protease YugP